MYLERLRHLRMSRGLSQKELSRRSGVDRGAISELENGRRGAQPSTARRLAAALGVEVEQLMGAEKEAV